MFGPVRDVIVFSVKRSERRRRGSAPFVIVGWCMISLGGPIAARNFLDVETLAPEIPARAAAARCGFAVDQSAFFEVVRGHLDLNPVAQYRPDAETPHPAGGISDNPMLVVEQDAKASVGQDFLDQAIERQ